jgi:transcriptional regulator with XRE-family HTH domain
LVRFGVSLKQARASAGQTQKEAAEAVCQLQQDVGGQHKQRAVSQGLIAQYESGSIGDPDPTILYFLARVYKRDYLELISLLVREKYDTGNNWQEGHGCERWAVLRATWLQPERIGELRDIEGQVISPGVSGFERDQLLAKAQLIARATVLSVKAMARWEVEAPDVRKFWVIAPEFIADSDPDIREAVARNLLKHPPVEYEYFIHPTNTGRFLAYKQLLKNHEEILRVKRLKVDRLIRAYTLDKQALRWLSTDHLVANPDYPEQALVFRYLRQSDTLFAHLLDRRDADNLLRNWKNWAKDKYRLREALSSR